MTGRAASPEPIAITGLGMVAPIGLGAEAACAAIRAGVTRFAEVKSPVLRGNQGERLRVVTSRVARWTDGLLGLGRFTRLGTEAIRDLIESSGLTESELRSTSLSLALPEQNRAGVDERIFTELSGTLTAWCRIHRLSDRTVVLPFGHAAAIRGLEEAMRALR